MFYKFISDKTTRWYCCVEAANLKEAIQKSKHKSWEQEPDVYQTYHLIEVAKDEQAYEDGDYMEDEATMF